MRRFLFSTAFVFLGLLLFPQQILATTLPANCYNYNNGTPISYEEFSDLLNNPPSGVASAYQLVTGGESYPMGANYYTQIDKVLSGNGWKQESVDTNTWIKYFENSKRCLELGRNLGCNTSSKTYTDNIINSFQINLTETTGGVCKQYGLGSSEQTTPSSSGIVNNIINTIQQLLHIGNQGRINTSQNTTSNDGVEIPVYPGAKPVPNIGRPVANGWNRLYVLNGDHINEVMQFYQNWLSKTGRPSLIQTPLGTSDLGSGVNNINCGATRVAFGPGGKVGEEHIYFHLETVAPGGCTFFLANGQPEMANQTTVMYVYNYEGFVKQYPSNSSSAYNVGPNNTVIDIYYTAKREPVSGKNLIIPVDNSIPNQKPLYIPSYPQSPSTADDWYKLIPKVSLGYFLDNLGHAFKSLLPFGWGK